MAFSHYILVISNNILTSIGIINNFLIILNMWILGLVRLFFKNLEKKHLAFVDLKYKVYMIYLTNEFLSHSFSICERKVKKLIIVFFLAWKQFVCNHKKSNMFSVWLNLFSYYVMLLWLKLISFGQPQSLIICYWHFCLANINKNQSFSIFPK